MPASTENPDSIESLLIGINAHLKKHPNELSTVVRWLTEHTGDGKLIPPEGEQQNGQTWGSLFMAFYQQKAFPMAADVTLAWYDCLCELQSRMGRRIHKGTPTQNTGAAYLEAGDRGMAFWFFACAFVEDVISETVKTGAKHIPENPAAWALRAHFRWSEDNLGELARIARETVDLHATDNLYWYPETALVRSAQLERTLAPLLRGANELPLNRKLLMRLSEALPEGDTNKAKGEDLEFLAAYLSLTLPGARIRRNAKTFGPHPFYEHEIDLIVTQYGAGSYMLESLGRHFIIECKNWSSRVSVDALNHFVAKMRFHGCKTGVVFSREGLSGDSNANGAPAFARLTQLRWYHQDGCVVIVIRKKELNEMVSGVCSFGEALLKGYEAVKFSDPRTLLTAQLP